MKPHFKAFLAAVFLAACSHAAVSQTTPVPAGYSVMGGQTELAASTGTSRVALPATAVPFGALTIYNKGAVPVYTKLGDVTVTAATTDIEIAPGTAIVEWVSANTYLAGITGSSTATLVVYQATGPVNFAGGGGSGGGGGGDASSANQLAVIGSKTGGTAATNSELGGAIFLTSRPTLTNGQQAALQMDNATNLYVNCAVGCNGANASVSATGASVPASGTYLGINIGGNLTGVLGGHGTAAGALRVELPTDGTGLVSAAQSGTWNITNVSGTVSLPTGAATSALQTTGNTTLGTLVTDTHFQNVVGTKNAGTAAANSLQAGLVYNSSPLTLTTGQQSSLQGDANGYLNVHVQAGGAGGSVTQLGATPTTTTMQSGATANGNGTVLTVTGLSSAILTVNCATCSGGTTINFEGTQDTTNYFPLDAKQIGSISATANSTTTSGITGWQIQTAGFTSIRARISAYSAGTVTVTGAGVATGYSPPTVNVVGGALDGAAITGALYNTIAGVAQSTITTCTTSTQCFMGLDPNNRALRVQLMPGTLTGSANDPYEVAASDNHRVIKNGAGTLRAVSYTNNSASLNYLRYYNAGTGFNGCNSATNLLFEIGIPANTSIAGDNPSIPPNGIAFSTGLSMCVTGAFGNTNTTNATASAISINTAYD